MQCVTAVDGYWLAKLGPMFFSVKDSERPGTEKRKKAMEHMQEMENQMKVAEEQIKAKKEESERKEASTYRKYVQTHFAYDKMGVNSVTFK